MTIARIWQAHAENRTVADVDLVTGSTKPTISSSQAYTGTYSYRHSSTSPQWGKSFTGVDGVRLAYYIYHAGILGGSTNVFIARFNVGNSLVRVDLTTSNTIRVYLGYQYNSASAYEPESATDCGDLDTQATWHHVGVNYYCHSSNGYLSVYVNGTQVYTTTGDTTVYAASQTSKEAASITAAYTVGGSLTNQWGSYPYIDDLYLDQYSGGEADIAPTSRRFLPSLVTANSGSPQWTPEGAANNYDCVDDGTPDDNSTYVWTNTVDQEDYYATGDITVPAGYVISAALVHAYCLKTDAGTDSKIRAQIKNGSDVISSADLTIGGSYSVVTGRFTTAPDGGAWSETDFNDSVFGIESRGTF